MDCCHQHFRSCGESETEPGTYEIPSVRRIRLSKQVYRRPHFPCILNLCESRRVQRG